MSSRYKKSAKLVTPDPNLAAWCAALATNTPEDKVPEGWHTSREIGVLLGKSNRHARELLQDAVASGRCEKKKFRIAAAGTVRPVPHYRLLK